MGDLLIGALIGLILTLTGAGGSVIASPLLVLYSNVSINDATGLALAAVFVSSACLSAYGYWRKMFVVRPVVLLALSGMVTACLARLVVVHLDQRVMGVLFSMMALGFSTYYLLGDQIYAGFRRRFPARDSTPERTAAPGWSKLSAWGGLAGGLSGFFGIGGGIIMIPVVMKVLRVDPTKVIYYCLPAICLITSSGALTFITFATPDILSHLQYLLIGALFGSVVGLLILPLVDQKKNLRLLGAAVLFFGLVTLYRSLS